MCFEELIKHYQFKYSIFKYLNHYKECHYCNLYINLNEDNIFQIYGPGKNNKKYICFHCINTK
jgi:hypothetical protein